MHDAHKAARGRLRSKLKLKLDLSDFKVPKGKDCTLLVGDVRGIDTGVDRQPDGVASADNGNARRREICGTLLVQGRAQAGDGGVKGRGLACAVQPPC